MPAGEPAIGADPPPVVPRQAQRRAETRQRILTAAQGLFREHGYPNTSIEEIATTAGVGIRTIYLHFPGKAAILLAYFDGWLDAFVDGIRQRPLDEPVLESVRAALQTMSEAGWTDRTEGDLQHAYPFLEQLTSGPLDIAGHVLQRWMGALDQLAEDAAARNGPHADPLTARARAGAVFAAWVANMSAVQASRRGEQVPPGVSGNELGMEILRHMTSGDV